MLADAEKLPTIVAGPFAFRMIVEQDVEDLHAIFGDPEVMRYWSHAAFEDIEGARDYYRQIREGFEKRNLFQWGLVRREEDRVIGTATLCYFDEAHRNCCIGYALARAEWGGGVMSRALPEVIRFAFETFDLHRIEADIDPRNPGSIRLLEKIGFQKEGCRREAYFVNDEIQDAAVYGLLKREFSGG